MPDQNALNWEEYESVTKYIYKTLGEQYGIKVIGYGRDCKLKGKSGTTHQIDVLTEQSEGERMHRTAIECKFIKKNVTRDTVMKLLQVMEDTGIENGIIVCKTGFTRDTLIYAEHKGIKLVELRVVDEDDNNDNRTMEIGTLEINASMKVSRANVTSIDFGSMVITGEREIMSMYYVKLHDSYDRQIPFTKYIMAFSDELESRRELLKTATIDFPVSGKLFLKLRDREIVVEKISITGFFTKTDKSSKRSFQLTDQVWMIMKEIFDKKALALSKFGIIWNLP
jgi:predicted site-specific integrase-resolvase